MFLLEKLDGFRGNGVALVCAHFANEFSKTLLLQKRVSVADLTHTGCVACPTPNQQALRRSVDATHRDPRRNQREPKDFQVQNHSKPWKSYPTVIRGTEVHIAVDPSRNKNLVFHTYEAMASAQSSRTQHAASKNGKISGKKYHKVCNSSDCPWAWSI